MQSFVSSRFSCYAVLLLCGAIAISGCKPTQSTGSQSAAQSTEAKTSEAKTTESKTVANASAASSGTPTFNLADRRVIEQYDGKFMPDFEKKIAENCKGSIVKIKVDWNTFGNGDEASKTIEALTNSNAVNRSVESVVSSLQTICNDDAGRKAVAEKLKTLNISHVKDASEPSFKAENGSMTLLLNVTKSDSPWTQDMQKAIEKTL